MKGHAFRHLVTEKEQDDEITSKDLAQFQFLVKQLLGIDDLSIWQPDSRLSSPEQTWNLYKQAFTLNDLDLALKCVLPSLKDMHTEMFSSISSEKLVEIGKQMSSIEGIIVEDGYAKYRTKRKQTHNGKSYDISYYIYFKNVFGEWRIERL